MACPYPGSTGLGFSLGYSSTSGGYEKPELLEAQYLLREARASILQSVSAMTAEGLSCRVISDRLGFSLRTVKRWRKRARECGVLAPREAPAQQAA